MTKHFHPVLWQKVAGGIDRLMRRVTAGYVRYFHRRYGTSGPMFAGEYRARRLDGLKTFMWRVGGVDGYFEYMRKRAERNALDEELRIDSGW